MATDYLRSILLMVYTCGPLLGFMVVAKITMPYSKKMITYVHQLSMRKWFGKILFALLIVINLVLVLSSVSLPISLIDVVIRILYAVLMGIITGGICLAILRYSYDYIVDNEYENK